MRLDASTVPSREASAILACTMERWERRYEGPLQQEKWSRSVRLLVRTGCGRGEWEMDGLYIIYIVFLNFMRLGFYRSRQGCKIYWRLHERAVGRRAIYIIRVPPPRDGVEKQVLYSPSVQADGYFFEEWEGKI